jgi:hypothetical protein
MIKKRFYRVYSRNQSFNLKKNDESVGSWIYKKMYIFSGSESWKREEKKNTENRSIFLVCVFFFSFSETTPLDWFFDVYSNGEKLFFFLLVEGEK